MGRFKEMKFTLLKGSCAGRRRSATLGAFLRPYYSFRSLLVFGCFILAPRRMPVRGVGAANAPCACSGGMGCLKAAGGVVQAANGTDRYWRTKKESDDGRDGGDREVGSRGERVNKKSGENVEVGSG